MFGNVLGWIISVGIAGITGLTIVMYGTAPNVSSSSGTFTAFVKSAKLSVDPATIDLKPGTKDSDATPLYNQVAEDYIANKHEYQDNSHSDSVWLHDHQPKIVDLIVEAADCARGVPIGSKADSVINYNYPLDRIDGLQLAGLEACNIAAVDMAKKNYAKSKPLIRAAYVLGNRMYAERLRWDEYTHGTYLMKIAASGEVNIASEAKDDATVKKCSDLVDAIDDVTKKATPLWTAICAVGSNDGSPLEYPGDMFEIALGAGNDPMWRIEAILKLGRMRFMGNVERIDQNGATRVVTKLAESTAPDVTPGIRLAAQKARDLDHEGFIKFGT